MKRLSYNPKVKAYINITSPNNPDFRKTIDISDDIIDGSVQLRLDGLSTATFKLQNKNGKYLGGYVSTNNEAKRGYIFTPMDKIIIAAGRITDPFQIFTGYLDEVPAFQLYPDAVTIKASSTIKRLYNTYFDPGLPYLIQYFAEQGYAYDPQTGLLSDPLSRFGNWGVYGGIGELMKNTLRDIARWPEDQITFAPLPKSFVNGIETATGNFGISLGTSPGGTGNLPPPGGGSNGVTFPTNLYDEKQIVNSLKIMEGLVSRGFTISAAAGITGNASVESSFDTGNLNSIGAFGLWQWYYPPRIQALFDLAKTRGVSPSNFKLQLDHVTENLKSHYASTYDEIQKNGKSPEQAAKVFAINYEDPGKSSSDGLDGSLSKRQDAARTAYKDFLKAWPQYSKAQPAQFFGSLPINLGPSLKDKADSNEISKADNPVRSAKASAPNTKPDSSGQFKATVDSNADDPSNGHIKQYTVDAVSRIANVFGQNLLITTGTRHGQKVAGTDNQSPHISGWAADIPSKGDELIRLGRSALIAFGVDPVEANKQDGGGFDVGGQFKVIFNTNSSAAGGNHTDHLHISLWMDKAKNGFLPDLPVNPSTKASLAKWQNTGPASAYGSGSQVAAPILPGVPAGSVVSTVGGGSLQPSFNSETNTDLANGFVSQSLTSTDSTLSYLLTGDHALANDIPFIEWIKDLNTSSGRVFCSAPNGDFYSFFPDYFGWFNTTPYFYISDIETIDLNIQLSDQDLITHIYGIGPLIGYTKITPIDNAVSPIASVQEEAFTSFIKTNTEITPGPTGSEIWRTALQDLAHLNSSGKWDSTAFLDRYGARPKSITFNNIRNPALLWMATWMEFMKAWAKRYHSSASFTFMPELFPGGRVNIADRIEMFVESVTHNFSYSSGFSTSASLIAPTATGGVNLDGEAERTIRSASQVSNSSPDTGNGGN